MAFFRDHKIRAVVVAGVVAVVCGCSRSKDVAPDEFGEEAAPIVCKKVYECCMPMELMGHPQHSPNAAACETQNKSSLGFWAAIAGQEEKKGRLVFHRDLARTCLDSYGAATCESHKRNESLAGCDTFLEPKTAVGSACGMDESCVGGSCEGRAEQKDGVCKPFAKEGESCMGAKCSKGLMCQAGTNICRPAKNNGETCNLHGECASGGCNGRNADAGTPGTCGLKGGETSRCYVTVGCALAPTGVGRHAASAAFIPALGLITIVLARRRRVRH